MTKINTEYTSQDHEFREQDVYALAKYNWTIRKFRQRGIKESARIANIGSGSGTFTKILVKEGYDVFSTEPDNEARNQATQNCPGIQFHAYGLFDLPEEEMFDVIVMHDVLEHIEDDLSALTDYVKRAPSGSLFLISVPAFEFLWSPHDIFLGHFRRYTLKSLKVLVVSSGLDCMEAKYLFGPIFPLVFLIRKIKNLKQTRPSNSDMKKPTPLVNFILTNVLKRTGWPNKNGVAGTSAFVVARKN